MFDRTILSILFILLLSLSSFASSEALFNKTSQNVAIDGYDTVAYFTEGKASKGKPSIQSTYLDVTWFFLNVEHKALFDSNPSKYVPEYSGHCANGLSDGHLVTANPEIFRIIDGQLYLFYSWWGKAQWKFNQKEQIELADRYWLEFSNDSY
jgi:YHS domain-containing protein